LQRGSRTTASSSTLVSAPGRPSSISTGTCSTEMRCPASTRSSRDRSSRQEIRQTVRVELIATIESELKEARLARDDDRRNALALILASLRAAEKELQRPLSEDEE